ncbi:MAG: magnesium transporter [Planctomycetaceae bacterium]|nr:magnesium transporter [Planctomycetaceae bacterium]
MFNSLLLPDLRQMLEENDAAGLREFCEILHPAGVAEVLQDLSSADVWKVLSHCGLVRQVEIFEHLSLTRQVELVDLIGRDRLSKIIEEMSPDDRADLLNRLEPARVEALLPLVAQAERADIRKLLSYPEHSAGSIMTTEYASLPVNITVREAIDRLRQQAPNSETIYYVYILDADRHLQGLTTLRQLILARPDTKLVDLVNRDVIAVRVDDDQEVVAQQLGRYDFIAIPVIDNQNRLVGIITHDDVLDIIQEEAEEDVLRAGAVEPFEDGYLETPLRTIAWKRGVWLVFLSLMALVTAWIIDRFEYVSEQYVWMGAFLPLVLASGGNTGSQSATLVIRLMALGKPGRGEKMRLTWREVVVGLMLGGFLAAIDFVFIRFWFGRTWTESFVVSATVGGVVLLGSLWGTLLPLIFRKLGMDPALMSNPLIAAFMDMMGVLLYYSIALTLLGTVAG